jgi:hypothetical protein
MRLKQLACAVFLLSFAATCLAERATSAAYGQSFFGFFSPPRFYQTYSAPRWVYPPLTIVQRRVKKKVHHRYARKAPFNPVASVNAVAHNNPTASEWSLLAKRLAAMQKADPGALAVFLNDSTLRRKDAVMTSTGIFVFTGQPSASHSRQDFAALAQSRGLTHYAELSAIEKVSVPRFEIAQNEKPSRLTFADVPPAIRSFEAVETKAVRHIAGVFD